MKVYISTGERSGALYAKLLAALLKSREPDTEISGCVDGTDDAPVGFAAGIGNAHGTLERMRQIEREVRRIRPHVFLAVAWSEPNTLLGLRLKDLRSMRKVFFAPPQLWAWGRFRAAFLRRGYDALLCLYPEEARFLRSLELPAYFAGNPLVERLASYFKKRPEPAKASRAIAVLAGSRASEQARHNDTLAGFAGSWKKLYPNDTLVWLFLSEDQARSARKYLKTSDEIVWGEERYLALSRADLAVVASGTASLETALLGTPQVVYYSLPRSEVALIRLLTRVKSFALPNLITGQNVVPELLNPDPEELIQAGRSALEEGERSLTLALKLRLKLSLPLDNSFGLFRLILSK